MCKFIHLRQQTEWHETDQGTRRGIATKGGVTLAFEHNGNTVMYAVAKCHWRNNFCNAFAKCHWRNNFCEHTGRAKSQGRLKSPHQREVFRLDNEHATSAEIQQAVIDHYQANEEF